MYIYITSNTTGKVLHQHSTGDMVTKKEFLSKAIRLVFKINQMEPPKTFDINDDVAEHTGVEITGCKLTINQTPYSVFIQGLYLDDLEQFHGKEETLADALEE